MIQEKNNLEMKRKKEEMLKFLAYQLMQADLTPEEIIAIYDYALKRFSYKPTGNPAGLLLEAWRYSFFSKKPFHSAKIYMLNVIKISPESRDMLQDTMASFLKNSILGLGRFFNTVKFRIRTNNEYMNFTNFLNREIGLKIPSKDEVLDRIIAQEKSLIRIINRPEIFKNLVEIFGKSTIPTKEKFLVLCETLLDRLEKRFDKLDLAIESAIEDGNVAKEERLKEKMYLYYKLWNDIKDARKFIRRELEVAKQNNGKEQE